MKKLVSFLVRIAKFLISWSGVSLLLVMWIFVMIYVPSVTVSSVSPSGSRKVSLLDYRFYFIDRNFWIVLEDHQNWFGSKTEIFRSGDEEHRGTARFLWSKDETKLLMLGKGFEDWELAGVRLTTGEDIYMLYDLQLRTTRRYTSCKFRGKERFFTADDLREIDFGEPLRATKSCENAV